MKSPILGSAYVARSINAADNRMVNLFPEIVPEGGKEPAFLNRAPGLRLLATIGSGPIRGLWVVGGYLYVVSGSELYKVSSAWSGTLLGTIGGTGPVSIASDEALIFLACEGFGYTYSYITNTFTHITDADFLGSDQVTFFSPNFVYTTPDGIVQWSDGASFSALQDIANIYPDLVTGVAVNHNQLWIFGETTASVWFNDETANFLSQFNGAVIETGCAATSSITKLDNSIFWLGQDARGKGIVYRSNGYAADRVSTHSIEWQIQQYADISDAIGYSYQQDGHSFYVLVFPSADATWVYDCSTQSWHERAGFVSGQFTRHRSNCQAFFNGLVVVGDYDNGKLYELDLDTYSDNGSPQKWLRSWRAIPTGQNDLKRTSHHSLQLDCESGVGLSTGQGDDPQAMLRWSDDGGHTWSNEHWTSMGSLGSYGTSVIWHRLGMTTKLRDRIYEVSGTDPVKVAITGAELKMSGTNG